MALPVALAALVAGGAIACLAPAAVLAAETRPLAGSFGPDGTSSTAFQELDQLAFNQATHDLYALDQSPADKLYGFDASTPGTYTPLGGNFPLTVDSHSQYEDDIAVNSSSGDIFFVSEFDDELYGFNSTGAPLGGNFPLTSFGDVCGIAVDASGNIWAGDYDNDEIDEFDSSGEQVGSVSTAAQGEPCHVALDSAGNLYVALWEGPTFEYTAASGYSLATEIDSAETHALTVDRSTGDVYVVHKTSVSVYDSAGNHLYNFGETVANAHYRGITFDEATGEVFLANDSGAGTKAVDVFGAPVPLPSVATTAAEPVGTSAATLRATVNPAGQQLTDCEFEYGTSTAYGQSAPCVPAVGAIPADSEGHEVTAEVSGLTPGETYHYRLVASNAYGESQARDVQFTTALGLPKIDSGTVVGTGLDSATLSAEINPQDAPTSVHVEYGTSSAYGASTTETASIGADASDHRVTVQLADLAPGATYHFRFVATNAVGATDGADQMFATYLPPPAFAPCLNEQFRVGAGLPDCRAYEQASPVEKNGLGVSGNEFTLSASPEGNAVSFASASPLPGAEGAQWYANYLAQRSSSGWTTRGMFPSESVGDTVGVIGWTPDLSESLITAASSQALAGSNGTSLLLRNNSDGSLSTIVPNSVGAYRFYYVGASEDGSKVFFENPDRQLIPGAAANQDNLYEWDQGTHQLYLVGVLPESACGTPPCVPAAGSFAGPYAWYGGSHLGTGGAEASNYLEAERAVSSDGSRVFFTASGTGQLYVRENPTSADATTLRVSASQKTNGTGAGGSDPHGPKPAAFMAASADGSQAFFTSSEELTNEATTGSADQGNDLYNYDVNTEALTDLTPDPGDVDGAEVQGVLGTSSDGSYVYFAANGVLAAGATLGDCNSLTAEVGSFSGSCNLYVWHDGATKFIAELNISASEGVPRDAKDWEPGEVGLGGGQTARVTPDGQTLLFRSVVNQTSYDSKGISEFYRYSAASAHIDCVSCNPTGAPPVTAPGLAGTPGGAESAATGFPIQQRNLSSSGEQVFFDSPEGLVSGDTNGVGDVYEWEAAGAGSCQSSAQDGGCLYPLSTGRDASPSYFVDASASGDDVFIYTDEQLVGQDGDDAYDVYDVRVGGGLASQHPSASALCSGEECKGQVSSPSVFGAPGSATLFGSGNLTPPAAKPAAEPMGKALSRAQKLARALRACKSKVKKKRASCEAQARKKYGAGHKPKANRKKSSRRSK